MSWVVYTSIANEYDTVLPVLGDQGGMRFFVLSTERPKVVWNWNWIPTPYPKERTDSIGYNRYFKFQPQLIFPHATGSIYIDGNVLIQQSINSLIEDFERSEKPVGLFKHCARSSLNEELNACVEKDKIRPSERTAFIELFMELGLVEELDKPILTENSIIFWRHCEDTLKIGQLLWDSFRSNLRRDQLSLPLVLLQSQIDVHRWNWNFRANNKYFSIPTDHRASRGVVSDAIYGLRVLRWKYSSGDITLGDIISTLNLRIDV